MAAPEVDGYELHETIGRGGASVVFGATELVSGLPVALKVLADRDDEITASRKALREAGALRRLGDTEGVVAIRAVVETTDGRPVLVMDRMIESAADRLRREGPWSVEDVVTTGIVVAEALHRCHDQGIVHRDLKPANVLIGPDGTVAISDFDIATFAASPSSTVTRASMTPPHCPPERLRGHDDGTVAGDIWALGSTLYTLLAGETPFGSAEDAGGAAGLMERVAAAPLPSLERSDVPAALWLVIETALAKAPHERFSSADAMAHALRAAASAGDVERTPSQRSESALRTSTSWRRAAETALITAGSLAVGTAIGWLVLR